MSARASARLAWSLCGLSLLLFSAAVVLFASARLAPVPDSRGAALQVGDLLPYVPFLAFPAEGAASGVSLRGDPRFGQRWEHAFPGSAGASRGGAKPVRVGGSPLGRYR